MTEKSSWEYFSDPAYFDMWAIKRETDKSFYNAIHVATELEAKYLCSELNKVKEQQAEIIRLKASIEAKDKAFNKICRIASGVEPSDPNSWLTTHQAINNLATAALKEGE